MLKDGVKKLGRMVTIRGISRQMTANSSAGPIARIYRRVFMMRVSPLQMCGYVANYNKTSAFSSITG